jgi:hypothetical protein
VWREVTCGISRFIKFPIKSMYDNVGQASQLDRTLLEFQVSGYVSGFDPGVWSGFFTYLCVPPCGDIDVQLAVASPGTILGFKVDAVWMSTYPP